MKSTFVDSFCFIAVLNRNDAAHGRALDAIRQIKGRLVTTEFVLLEVADAFANPIDRPAFLQLMEELTHDPSVVVEPASTELLHAGLELFRRRPDKDWPLTDCISFVIMDRHNITEALAGDHHFQQAGYSILLK